jgi:hypothetical protein
VKEKETTPKFAVATHFFAQHKRLKQRKKDNPSHFVEKRITNIEKSVNKICSLLTEKHGFLYL